MGRRRGSTERAPCVPGTGYEGVLRGAGARLSECQGSVLPRPTKWSSTYNADEGQGWPVFFERTATALGDVVEFGEYHRLLASAKGPRSKGDVWHRWEGHLWRMKTLRGEPSDTPSLVCVHGFGASCNQWERLTEALPHDIEHVVAVELLGLSLIHI